MLLMGRFVSILLSRWGMDGEEVELSTCRGSQMGQQAGGTGTRRFINQFLLRGRCENFNSRSGGGHPGRMMLLDAASGATAPDKKGRGPPAICEALRRTVCQHVARLVERNVLDCNSVVF